MLCSYVIVRQLYILRNIKLRSCSGQHRCTSIGIVQVESPWRDVVTTTSDLGIIQHWFQGLEAPSREYSVNGIYLIDCPLFRIPWHNISLTGHPNE